MSLTKTFILTAVLLGARVSPAAAAGLSAEAAKGRAAKRVERLRKPDDKAAALASFDAMLASGVSPETGLALLSAGVDRKLKGRHFASLAKALSKGSPENAQEAAEAAVDVLASKQPASSAAAAIDAAARVAKGADRKKTVEELLSPREDAYDPFNPQKNIGSPRAPDSTAHDVRYPGQR